MSVNFKWCHIHYPSLWNIETYRNKNLFYKSTLFLSLLSKFKYFSLNSSLAAPGALTFSLQHNRGNQICFKVGSLIECVLALIASVTFYLFQCYWKIPPKWLCRVNSIFVHIKGCLCQIVPPDPFLNFTDWHISKCNKKCIFCTKIINIIFWPNHFFVQ